MGILMYELLTGKLPYRGENAVEIALKHLKEPLPSIREEIPNIPNSIENIIKKATAKNIKNRYNDAREMHEDLLTCLGDSRTKEPPYEFKYSENNYDDTKMVKIIKNPNETKQTKKSENDDAIAKQINPEELKKQNKLVVLLAAIFTGLVVIITSVIVLIPLVTGGKELKVPDVTGMSVTEAIDTLQDEGFKVADEQQEVSSTEIEEGNIVKTNPAAGSKRTKGTSITLYVSVGDTKIEIEDYLEKNYLEVKGALEALGLKVVIEKKDVDEDSKYTDGQIIEQSVEAGEKLSVGETITLYIPNIVSKFPNFTDGSYSVDEIQTFCDEHNIKLDVEYVETSDYSEGTIYNQNKPEGYTIVEGVTLKIKVAKAVTQEEEDCTETGLC
jgi:serine/threonine-protein kinase